MKRIRRADTSAFDLRPTTEDLEAYDARREPTGLAPREQTYTGHERWSIRNVAHVLDFEARPLSTGRRQDLITKHFKVSVARYEQSLSRILRTQAAVEYNPQLVNRLTTERRQRVEARAARTFHCP